MPAMCTVFRIDKSGATRPNDANSGSPSRPSAVATSSTGWSSLANSTAPASVAPVSPVRSLRWSIPLQSSNHVQLDYSRPYQSDSSALGLECSCVSQLSGHQQHMAFTRAAIWSYVPSGTGAKMQADGPPSVPRRVLVACGDEDTNQVSAAIM
jgi:hypothetical protein